uniref:Uncharacterized protein n=1 Tax=Arundo donax TaxID=35708 RepID=A0A0A9GZC1_ARUDO
MEHFPLPKACKICRGVQSTAKREVIDLVPFLQHASKVLQGQFSFT